MFVAILVTILAIFLSSLDRKGSKVSGLKLAFVIITLYLSIRYDYGNDYLGYLDSFNGYKSYRSSLLDISALTDLHGHGDWGWVLLNILFQPVGFFVMVIILTILENIVVYDFIKTYVSKTWYPFAVFIYTMNTNLMIVGGSMMRQWLAICIFIYAFRFIRDKKPIYFFLLILIASKFHSSANILYPMYFIGYLRDVKLSSKSLYWFIPFLVSWFVVAPMVFQNNLGFLFSMESFEHFEIYEGTGTGEKFGILGIIGAFLFPVICISQVNKFDSNVRSLVLIYFCSILIRPLGLVLGMVNRMSFYFMAYSIVVFPIAMQEIRKIKIDYVYMLMIIIIVPMLRDYWAFFHSEVWIDHFMTYKTIFGVPWQ